MMNNYINCLEFNEDNENKEKTKESIYQVLKIVSEINDFLHEEFDLEKRDDHFDWWENYLQFSSDGGSYSVDFNKEHLWFSDDVEERQYFEDKQEFEPLKNFLLKKLSKIMVKKTRNKFNRLGGI